MAKPLKYSLILIVLGILAGFLLAFVNSFTSEIINERKQEEVRLALIEHFPYDSYSIDQSDNYTNLDSKILEIYFGFGADKKLSSVIYKTKGIGYGGEVISLVCINADGTFVDVKMVEASKETKGIGDKVFNHDFKIATESVGSYDAEVLARSSMTSNAVIGGIEAAANHFKTIADTLGGITND